MVRLRLTPAARGRIGEYVAHRRDLLLDALDRLDDQARRDILRAAPHLHRLAGVLADQEGGEQQRTDTARREPERRP